MIVINQNTEQLDLIVLLNDVKIEFLCITWKFLISGVKALSNFC